MTAPQMPRPRVSGPATTPATPGTAAAAEPSLPQGRPTLPREQLLAACERGLDLCRFGNFKEGLAELAALGDLTRVKDIPSAYFSYLGYALAKQRNQFQQGIKLCRHSIKLEFFQTENYVNLARTCLLSEKYRREAWDAVREGLRIDPDHPELLEIQRQLGSRKPPILGFLGRNNPLNRLLGSLRHLLSRDVGSKKKPTASKRSTRQPSEVVSLS